MNKNALRRSTAVPGLPDSALSDCLFVTGKRGGGKSYSQRLAFERALSKGMRCGWIDSLGVGWGITVAGDPSNLEKPVGAGYDVVVFGGDHGHMPLAPSAGAALGTMLAKAKFSWVIDLKNFKSKAQRVAFMADFIEALYENCEAQLLLLLDEVDLWAPQIIIDKQGPAPRLLGAVDEIVRRGRIKGIVAWMATQRPAVVNKNVISQADGMLAFKTVAPQDTEAVMAWMKAHLKKGAYDEWLAQLSALKKGEAIVYLTEPDISIRRQQFPLIDTLDTFKPQKGGHRQSDTLAAKPDIEALKDQLGALEERLKSEDPVHLKAEISRLTRELAAAAKVAASGAAPKADVAEVRKKAFDEGVVAGQRQGERQLKAIKAVVAKEIAAMQRKISVILANMAKHARTVEDGIEALKKAALEINGATGLSFPELDAELEKMAKVVTAGGPLPPPATPRPARPVPSREPRTGRGGAEMRILKVLTTRFPARFTMSQWAALAVMKKSGGTWGTMSAACASPAIWTRVKARSRQAKPA